MGGLAIFEFIKNIFSSLSSGTSRFLDLAGKFDKKEIESLMGRMKEKEQGYFKRGKTIIISETAIKYLALAKMKREDLEDDPFANS